MARNEEKQLGKLNRLWLQKEKEEGRIIDIHVPRPKLGTLNSVEAVKKWIPSIKKEIEYYLQQSQLSHYPERKIDEFHQHIEGLQREYKRYLNKLRFLDPTCKTTPWKPRSYTKRRQEPNNSQNTSKRSCLNSLSTLSRAEDVNGDTNPDATEQPTSHATVLPSVSTPITTQASDLPDQDLPLCFDQTLLWVAVASSRVALVGQQQDTGRLTRVLFSGLPNLHSLPLARKAATEKQQPSNAESPRDKNILGLGCYLSSSDEEVD
ncbi:uncharacterized protein si:dkey-86e18.1 [Triplophysa rosa]|uniref:Uncharacterized protein n=1 Tax=Triplophysa rosa TaxID=992332 RepID=A0A9W7TLJ6_TRIRA|nr:uncharacterized protein si:dkey-86e18.1 [Triplophysa rosa]KAI7799512.1 hypothetical protein IRJ41_004821 [Triplophysa rosa]